MTVKIYDNFQTDVSQFAVRELIAYMQAIYPIQVIQTFEREQADIHFEYVASDNKHETIDVRIENQKGHITANYDSAILIAVYRLIEAMGMRFTRPGKHNEIIPQKTLEEWQTLNVEIKHTASYWHRGICIEGADSFENICDVIDWLPKIGMNSFFIQFENPYTFLKRWYEHEFNPYLSVEEFTTERSEQMSAAIDDEMRKRGVNHHRVGHGWTSEALGYSSKFGWQEGEKISEEKRPFVAQLNGERELFKGIPIMTSICFSNDDVVENMIYQIVKYAKERQDVHYLHVWLSDARNNICECEKCQMHTPSDQYIDFLNELDRLLTNEGLDTKICFLLYHELLFAPKASKLQNPERFVLMFAPITRTFEKSYADLDLSQHVETPEYIRNKMVLPNSIEENVAYLQDWQTDFKGDGFVYDYPLGRAHYGDFGYVDISKIIAQDIKTLEQLGLDGYISCQELRAGFPNYLPNYIMGQFLWDKQADFDEMQQDYFSHIYGEYAPEVTKYLTKVSELSSCDYYNAIGERVNHERSEKYYELYNFVKESLPLLKKGQSEASVAQKKEWQILGYHRHVIEKLSLSLYHLSKDEVEVANQIWEEILDMIRRNEMVYQDALDVYRMIEVTHNYAGLKEKKK